MKFVINNIKCRFRIASLQYKRYIADLSLFYSVKVNGNITSIHTEDCVYIIFNTSGHVNVTGIKKIEHIEGCIETFLDIFCINEQISGLDIKIDNISASGFIGLPLLLSLKEIENASLHINGLVTFNQGRFPGICVKTPHGTAIIFQSGKINVVGIRKVGDLIIFEEYADKIYELVKLNKKI
jgi:TATA-box binding protein (TBP) (component of TFIID and TFIIIB)